MERERASRSSSIIITHRLAWFSLQKIIRHSQTTVTLCSLLPILVLDRFCGVSGQKIKLREIQNFPVSKLAYPQCKIFPCPSKHILNELNGLQFWKQNTCPKTTGLTQKEDLKAWYFCEKRVGLILELDPKFLFMVSWPWQSQCL